MNMFDFDNTPNSRPLILDPFSGPRKVISGAAAVATTADL
jgi:hypothetical protein